MSGSVRFFSCLQTGLNSALETVADENGLPPSSDATKDIGEWFAPAEFVKMKDAEKLKAPAYEFFDCGVEVGGGEVQFGTTAQRTVDYEEIILDPAINSRVAGTAKRPLKATEKLLAELTPVRVTTDERKPEVSLKAAPTAFAAARIPGLRKVA